MNASCYTREYYDELKTGAALSAGVIVPIVLALLPVRSAVDVGCGEGAWLAAFRKSGVEDILGIDGDYVDRNALQIPADRFRAADLSNPLSLERTFDLAVSLEVAEHLPPDSAGVFVESLTRVAPAVLFSAAIPFQSGTNHVNEQWPEKWAELFRQRGYVPIDAIRRRVWRNEAVEPWYAQNTLLFVDPSLLEGNSRLRGEFERTELEQLPLVHPTQYLTLYGLYADALDREAYLIAHPASGVRQASRILWQCVKNAVKDRIHG
jgi:SAM-dependent methyltransferase